MAYWQIHCQLADIVQSADDRMSADYLKYRIGRISLSANFPNLDIVCTLTNGMVLYGIYFRLTGFIVQPMNLVTLAGRVQIQLHATSGTGWYPGTQKTEHQTKIV